MSQKSTLNVKLFNSQLNKLRKGIKNDTEVNAAGGSNDEIIFHKLVINY